MKVESWNEVHVDWKCRSAILAGKLYVTSQGKAPILPHKPRPSPRRLIVQLLLHPLRVPSKAECHKVDVYAAFAPPYAAPISHNADLASASNIIISPRV